MASPQDLQAIVDGWNPNKFSPEPPLEDAQRAVLKKLKTAGITPTGVSSIYDTDRKLQTAIQLAGRDPPLARLDKYGTYQITKEGYEVLVPERKVLTSLLGIFRWVLGLDSTLSTTGAALQLGLQSASVKSDLVELYFGKLASKGLVTLETKTISEGQAHETAKLTPLGAELVNYLTGQAAARS